MTKLDQVQNVNGMGKLHKVGEREIERDSSMSGRSRQGRKTGKCNKVSSSTGWADQQCVAKY